MFEAEWDSEELNRILRESRYMETPFFLLSKDRLRDNVTLLKKKAEGKFAVCFSVKSNPWYIADAAECADYVEVCSPGEWELCKAQGISSDRIIAGGIYKSDKELKELVEAGTHRISVESMEQLVRADKYASADRVGADILLRISSGNQFGMDLDMVVDILKHQNRFPSLRFRGIHYYSGTQKRRIKDVEEDIALLESVEEKVQGNFMEIEYGPGLGVPQFQNHNQEEYASCLSHLLNRLKGLSRRFRITLECGRLLTADTGVYVTEIVDKKVNNGRTYYIVDGGIHHLQYDGQIKGQFSPFIYAGKDNGTDGNRETAICGALCTANDVLARLVNLPEKKTGERLIFLNAGAYCVTEGISLFLSRDLPGVVMEKQKIMTIMRSHTASYPFNMKQHFSEVGSDSFRREAKQRDAELEIERSTYMRIELEKRVLKCLNKVLSAPVEALDPQTDLRAGLELNSLNMVMLQVEIEEEFRFTFDPVEDNFEKIFETFGNLCGYLENRE